MEKHVLGGIQFGSDRKVVEINEVHEVDEVNELQEPKVTQNQRRTGMLMAAEVLTRARSNSDE